MDLSLETTTNIQKNDESNSFTDTLCPSSNSFQTVDEIEIIDLSKINFDDDETWLYESAYKSDIDLQKWLYDSMSDSIQNTLDSTLINSSTTLMHSFITEEEMLRGISALGTDMDISNVAVFMNAKFTKDNSFSKASVILDCVDELDETITISKTFNTRINQKSNDTFILNNTFQRQKDNKINVANGADLHETFTKESNQKINDKPEESIKRVLNRRLSSSMDSINMSYQTDDITVIVDVQGRSSTQIMSTPKPGTSNQMLWPIMNDISPISGHNSDPELSSIEKIDQKTMINKPKSIDNLTFKMPAPKSFGTLTRGGVIKGSQPNLRAFQKKGPVGLPKTVGHKLKGLYTKPVAPPPLRKTVTIATAKVAQVPKINTAQFGEPQPSTSELPRHMKGIPRLVSRISGPRTLKSVSKPGGQQGKQAK